MTLNYHLRTRTIIAINKELVAIGEHQFNYLTSMQPVGKASGIVGF
jgi:hypothetical protein